MPKNVRILCMPHSGYMITESILKNIFDVNLIKDCWQNTMKTPSEKTFSICVIMNPITLSNIVKANCIKCKDETVNFVSVYQLWAKYIAFYQKLKNKVIIRYEDIIYNRLRVLNILKKHMKVKLREIQLSTKMDHLIHIGKFGAFNNFQKAVAKIAKPSLRNQVRDMQSNILFQHIPIQLFKQYRYNDLIAF